MVEINVNVADVDFGITDYLCRNAHFFKKVQQAFKPSNVASVVLIYSV